MRHLILAACAVALLAVAAATCQAAEANRDAFFWLSQINKASLIINRDEGLLDRNLAPEFARALQTVIDNGSRPNAPRPSAVIRYEPLLIAASSPEITLIHAGRSSQDMHATYNFAMMRDELLDLASALDAVQASLLRLAADHRGTLVPAYTNGVAAQPTTWGHYLLGYAYAFNRDADRVREFYARVNRCPMGTTVLNGTSWPLNRQRMAEYLGFAAASEHAYDANQLYSLEMPVEAAGVVNHVALKVGNFLADVAQQYAQPQPWILLREGGANTYVSSAMPQKRNPGILMWARRDASSLLGDSAATLFRSHNLPPGQPDSRTRDTDKMMRASSKLLRTFDDILRALTINAERARDELNRDWTASQELADLLMRDHAIPFRVGHHVASEMVTCARQHGLTPLTFPYAEIRRIYREVIAATPLDGLPAEFPLTEAQFRAALDPAEIVRHRATSGATQPAEMSRMLDRMTASVAGQRQWLREERARLDRAEAKLNADFGKLLRP